MIYPIYEQITPIVEDELKRAMKDHGDAFNSNHEAWAVTREEIIEVREALDCVEQLLEHLDWRIRRDADIYTSNLEEIKEQAVCCACEAVQVAAMCDKWIKSGIL